MTHHEADPLVRGVERIGAGSRDVETLELAGAGNGLGHDEFPLSGPEDVWGFVV